jgi:hypothetical protein
MPLLVILIQIRRKETALYFVQISNESSKQPLKSGFFLFGKPRFFGILYKIGVLSQRLAPVYRVLIEELALTLPLVTLEQILVHPSVLH